MVPCIRAGSWGYFLDSNSKFCKISEIWVSDLVFQVKKYSWTLQIRMIWKLTAEIDEGRAYYPRDLIYGWSHIRRVKYFAEPYVKMAHLKSLTKAVSNTMGVSRTIPCPDICMGWQQILHPASRSLGFSIGWQLGTYFIIPFGMWDVAIPCLFLI